MTQIQQGPGNTLRGCCRFVMPNSSSTTALSEHGHGAWHTLLVAAIYGWSDVIHKGVEMGLSKTQVGIWGMLISNGPWVKKKQKKTYSPHHSTSSSSQDCYWYLAGWIHYFKFWFHCNLSQLKSPVIVIFIVVDKSRKKLIKNYFHLELCDSEEMSQVCIYIWIESDKDVPWNIQEWNLYSLIC